MHISDNQWLASAMGSDGEGSRVFGVVVDLLEMLPKWLAALAVSSTVLVLVAGVSTSIVGLCLSWDFWRLLRGTDRMPDSGYIAGLHNTPYSELSLLDKWFAWNVRLRPRGNLYSRFFARYLKAVEGRPNELRKLFLRRVMFALPMALISMLWTVVILWCVVVLVLGTVRF